MNPQIRIVLPAQLPDPWIDGSADAVGEGVDDEDDITQLLHVA